MSGQAQLVQRHAREIVEQGAEAVDRQPVGGELRVGLGLRALRDLGLLHGRAALRPGAFAVVVLEQHRREAPAHVPFDMQRQHAHEDVGADMVLRVDVDRTDPEVALGVPERALHAREALVRLHRGLRAKRRRIQAGADDVDPVEPRLGGGMPGEKLPCACAGKAGVPANSGMQKRRNS